MIEKKGQKGHFLSTKKNFSIKNDKGDFNSKSGIPLF